MAHDPMCWFADPERAAAAAINDAWPCICNLIRRVREDEQRGIANLTQAAYEGGYGVGVEDAARAIGGVQDEAQSGEGVIVTVLLGAGQGKVYIPRDKAVAAIRSLGAPDA